MTLTVRLPSLLDEALQDYCARNGVARSQVVQESLAHCLGRGSVAARAAGTGVSSNLAAFRKAGLIGCAQGGRIAAILRKYADLDPDWADATLVWLAKDSGIHRIAIVDARDLSTYRIPGRSKFILETPT